jgi:hypothetical protein
VVRDIIEPLSAAGELPSADRLVGVPRVDLDAWERELGIELPIDYRLFFWPDCKGIRELALEHLDADEYRAIPSDALFILAHQGYIFAWIDTTDPASPIYVSQPTDVDAREVTRVAGSFRDWLLPE